MSYRFEEDDVVIDGWEGGISTDPYSGLADMRNVNISGTPGEASVNFKTFGTTYPTRSGTLTLVNTGDYVQFGVGALAIGMTLTVGSTTGGLTSGTVYYVLAGLGDGVNFQLALNYAGSVVPITSDTTVSFATVNMGLPTARTTETKIVGGLSTATYYILDRNGRAWVTGNATLGNPSYWTYMNNTTLSNAYGGGIVVWKGYLFVFRANVIDVVSTATAPLSGGWTYGWKTLDSSNSAYSGSHFALVGQDDYIYYCDISVVGSINQVAGSTFDPSNSATYSYNDVALQLPTLEACTVLGELGVNLLVGGVRNWIYPWNRVPPATGVTGYSYPIMIPEQGTYSIVTANNVAYLFSGNRGRIYATNGSNVQEIGKIPDYITGTNKPYFYWKDAIWLRNKLVFSFSATSNNAPSTLLTTLGGIWSLDTESKVLQCENQLSYATYAGWASVLIAQFIPPTFGLITASGVPGEGYYAGWFDGVSSYGVDAFSNVDNASSLPYSNYESYIDSEKIPIGNFLNKATSHNLEFKLASPMVTGEKIKILARIGLSNSESPVDATAGYTLVGETLYSSSSENISAVYPINWEKAQWIQFRIRTSSTNTTPSYVRLREIRLRQN